MYKNHSITIKTFKDTKSIVTDSSSEKFYVPTIESRVNGKFADRFGKKIKYRKWQSGRYDSAGRYTRCKEVNTKSMYNTIYMNLRFDKYNSKNFKLVLADNGSTVAVRHRKKGIIKSMKWNTYDIAKAIANKARINTTIKYMDGTEISIKYSVSDVYNKIQVKPNIFRTCINVGYNRYDGSRHDHGCGFQINKRELVNF